MAKHHGRIDTSGGSGLGQNPFAGLGGPGALPPGPGGGATGAGKGNDASGEVAVGRKRGPAAGETGGAKSRGRVEIRRQTAGRGGKTVTVVEGFVGIGQPEKEKLAKLMQQRCGVGGTVKEGRIEIQGDQRERVAVVLAEAGFRPVMAGG